MDKDLLPAIALVKLAQTATGKPANKITYGTLMRLWQQLIALIRRNPQWVGALLGAPLGMLFGGRHKILGGLLGGLAGYGLGKYLPGVYNSWIYGTPHPETKPEPVSRTVKRPEYLESSTGVRYRPEQLASLPAKYRPSDEALAGLE